MRELLADAEIARLTADLAAARAEVQAFRFYPDEFCQGDEPAAAPPEPAPTTHEETP